jgi:hypothetical protein
MAKYVSVLGKWSPRKETAQMKNTFGKTITSDMIIGPDGSHTVKEGQVFIYNGPDREAIKMLKEAGTDTLGRDFRHDPEFLQAVRNMGFNGVDEYLKWIGFSEKEEFKKQMDLVSELATGKKDVQNEILELAGGRDFTGNKSNSFIGGFGPERLRSPEELSPKK